MATVMKKEEAHKLIDKMSDNASWDDLIHEIYVRETIERGLEDSKAGRTVTSAATPCETSIVGLVEI